MKVFEDTAKLAELGPGPAFVPTMGALHGGHLSLVERAKLTGRPVVVSIFVNPTQFNDPSDLDRYPRTMEADLAACEQAGADAVWVPPAADIYPPDLEIPTPPLPVVAAEPGLEDRQRPGFFAGVCQVVNRLFDLLQPSCAVFGEKDFQQLLTVRAMAAKLHPGIEIIGSATSREEDGLAMASRNALLSASDRERARRVPEALRAARREHDAFKAEDRARDTLTEAGLDIEYVAVRNATDLGAPSHSGANRVLVAARAPESGIRLIDNAAWPRSGPGSDSLS